jgi:hypothetical protein
MTAPVAGRCPWCDRSLPRGRRHGSARRFCRQACRHAFQTAARRWAVQQWERGMVTIADMQAVTANAEISAHASCAEGEQGTRQMAEAPQRSARALCEAV